MTWVLTICTAGWVLCGQMRTYEYQTEQQCYLAINELYKRNAKEDFKYVICAPKKGEPT